MSEMVAPSVAPAFGLRQLDLSIAHNFPGLGEDFPGGGDVVEALEAAPQDDHAGFAVVFAAEEAAKARDHPHRFARARRLGGWRCAAAGGAALRRVARRCGGWRGAAVGVAPERLPFSLREPLAGGRGAALGPASGAAQRGSARGCARMRGDARAGALGAVEWGDDDVEHQAAPA